jgi:hypothetical protein
MSPDTKKMLALVGEDLARIETRDPKTIALTYPQFGSMLPAQNATPEQWRTSFALMFLMLKDHESMIYQLSEKLKVVQALLEHSISELEDDTGNQEQETSEASTQHAAHQEG